MAAEGERASARRTAALAALAFAAPIVTVAALSLGPFANGVLPELIVEPYRSDQPATILTDLSQTMISMTLGVGVAAIWIYRQALRPGLRLRGEWLLLAGMLLALVSIYAGLRFRYDMAQQLRFEPLDLEPLRSRLTWQAGALLLQISTVCSAATLYHLHADRRFGARD